MAEWKLFPLDVPRPESGMKLDHSRRKLLENAVATTVSSLLALYGQIEVTCLDLTDDPETDSPTDFYEVTLDDFALSNHEAEDECSFLIVDQLPWTAHGVITEPGIHSVYIENNDGVPHPTYIVTDPLVDAERPLVVDLKFNEVPLDDLLELSQALQVILDTLEEDEDESPNSPALPVHKYPLPIDETFQAIVDGISFDIGE